MNVLISIFISNNLINEVMDKLLLAKLDSLYLC